MSEDKADAASILLVSRIIICRRKILSLRMVVIKRDNNVVNDIITFQY